MSCCNKTLSRSSLLIYLFLIAFTVQSKSFDNEFETRTSVFVNYKPINELLLTLNPEVRFDEQFIPSTFFVETDLAYIPVKALTIGGGYRFVTNEINSSQTTLHHRYNFFTEVKKNMFYVVHSFRLCYTNYSDDRSQNQFLRYRAQIEYPISKSKVSPLLGTEFFQDLDLMYLAKIRYNAGVKYQFTKKQAIDFEYKLEHYIHAMNNLHIAFIGYKLNF